MLTSDEIDELFHLLSQITIRAPWDATVGFDGATFTLRLEGPQSHAEFHWWSEVPKEWESIGAVFDHVWSLAKRHGFRPGRCG